MLFTQKDQLIASSRCFAFLFSLAQTLYKQQIFLGCAGIARWCLQAKSKNEEKADATNLHPKAQTASTGATGARKEASRADLITGEGEVDSTFLCAKMCSDPSCLEWVFCLSATCKITNAELWMKMHARNSKWRRMFVEEIQRMLWFAGLMLLIKPWSHVPLLFCTAAAVSFFVFQSESSPQKSVDLRDKLNESRKATGDNAHNTAPKDEPKERGGRNKHNNDRRFSGKNSDQERGHHANRSEKNPAGNHTMFLSTYDSKLWPFRTISFSSSEITVCWKQSQPRLFLFH